MGALQLSEDKDLWLMANKMEKELNDDKSTLRHLVDRYCRQDYTSTYVSQTDIISLVTAIEIKRERYLKVIDELKKRGKMLNSYHSISIREAIKMDINSKYGAPSK